MCKSWFGRSSGVAQCRVAGACHHPTAGSGLAGFRRHRVDVGGYIDSSPRPYMQILSAPIESKTTKFSCA